MDPACSPYPKLRDVKNEDLNAPVPDGFTEARSVLQEVENNRTVLETNLQRVLRNRGDVEVYSLVEALYHDGCVAFITTALIWDIFPGISQKLFPQ